MRIYQIADEVRMSNRILVQLLQDQGEDIPSHMFALEEEQETLLRSLVAELRPPAPAPIPAPEVEVKAPAAVVADPGRTVEADAESDVAEVAGAPTETVETTEVVPAETPDETDPGKPRIHEDDRAEPRDRPAAKPAGRRVMKIAERDVIEQSLQEMAEETKPEEAPKKVEPVQPGPDKTRTFRFHKRGQPGRTPRRKGGKGPQLPNIPTGPVDVVLPISVKDFSQALGVKVNEILKTLLQNGVRATINARLDRDTVDILAIEFGRELNIREKVAAEDAFLSDLEETEDRPEDLTPRAPVVAMLGHVDHGKTSLLDYIRKSDVASREAGGITQHISSYKIENEGKGIVFIDLPGHEAFTEMRGRGAQMTDIVILVVAAEEGVMPQTEECINHAKAAGVPMIVALNKCDKPEANPVKVKQLLASYGVIAEEYGGETIMVETSATKGTGIPDLLEAISLQAEVMEYKANHHKKAIGTVLEAEKSEGRGILATVLLQDGTLRPGDVALCGTGFGRIRDIRNDRGESVQIAGPSTPVEITGLSEVPEAGDRFYVVERLAKAKEIAEERARKQRVDSLAEKQTLSLADLFRKAGETATSEVPIIVKADTKGSVEAICQKLESLATQEVKIKVLHGAVGSVNESDVQLASASQAIILGFSVMAEDRARALAHERGVVIDFFQIIYELIDEVKLAMEARLAPEQREMLLGHAEVRAIFQSSKLGNIAGCYVTDGIIRRNARARVLRGGKIVHQRGRIDSLRRFKDDVKEVRDGFECGLKVTGFDELAQGDVVEVFEIQEFKRTLADAAAPDSE